MGNPNNPTYGEMRSRLADVAVVATFNHSTPSQAIRLTCAEVAYMLSRVQPQDEDERAKVLTQIIEDLDHAAAGVDDLCTLHPDSKTADAAVSRIREHARSRGLPA